MSSFYSSCNEGPARACSLSPSKFKIGVRDKSLTPINSPLILNPITATIRTRQIFYVITVLLNIVLCKGKGKEDGGGEEEEAGGGAEEAGRGTKNALKA